MLRRLIDKFDRHLMYLMHEMLGSNYLINRADQIQLILRYREVFERDRTVLSFRDVGFRCFSQTDEDGILLYLLSLTNMVTRKAVEVCAGNGVESNTANLIINHGYHALLLDGNARDVEEGRSFYRNNRNTRIWPPQYVQGWVTRDNINTILTENHFQGEIDVLSLDMDGVDYWIWKELTAVSPRVVVLEYQDAWGDEAALTVPYSESFQAVRFNGYPDYAGATLPAFVKLGRSKGYRLVGCNQYGYNAFFLRDDVGANMFPEVSAASCLTHPKNEYGVRVRKENARKFDWVSV
jgi:hypothetical protein